MVENARSRRSPTPSSGYDPADPNSNHQDTDERGSHHNRGLADSGIEHAEDSWITDEESERGDPDVLPVIFNLRRNPSQASINAASPSRRHRASIKSRAGSDTSAYSARQNYRKRERAKKAAIKLWNRLGGGAKNKPEAAQPPVRAQEQTSANSAQDDIFAAHLEATANRTFSGTGGGGLFPPFKPNTPFVTVLENADDHIKQQRASRSSAGDFVPLKAKRNLVSPMLTIQNLSRSAVIR